jgi:hypothetical protein
VDLWHRTFAPTLKDELKDLHDAYGPRESTKCIKAAFDAPLYAAFGNGDCSMLHDSGLFNVRGIWIWGILYNLAYEQYGDDRYAWLLNVFESQYTDRPRPGLPMPLQTHHADIDFARLGDIDYPDADFSPGGDANISVNGVLRQGCSHFPMYGMLVLRANGDDPMAPAASLYYGPHQAGHQSPAALHLDVHSGGRALTEAPRDHGYEKPTYLTWVRSTIAHNTVCIDERSMFPYDFATQSVFEADKWRDRLSAGELIQFEPGQHYHLARVRNDNVYPGVNLDRTVVVAAGYVLDVYRVTADTAHQIDWAVHCVGQIEANGDSVQLGSRRGYRHFEDARRLPAADGQVCLQWDCGGADQTLLLLPPAGADVLIAEDFVPHQERLLGELTPVPRRTCIIQRAHGADALFVALWPHAAPPETFSATGGARDDITVSIDTDTVVLPA